MRSSIFVLSALLVAGAQAQQKWNLQQCVQRAEERNLAIRNAQLDVELADQTHDQAYWSFLPNLNAGGTHGYNWGKSIDPYTNTFATDRVRTNNFWLSSDLSIYEGGRKRHTLKRSDLGEQAAVKALDASRNDVRTEVVRGFLTALGLRERIVAAEAQAANTREQVARTQALVDAGRAARVELLDIEAQLATEEFNVTDLQGQRDQALLRLGQALRLEPAEMAVFDIDGPPIGDMDITQPTATDDEVLRTVLATNPAYAAADLEAQSAEQSVTIARAATLPSLGFSGSLGTGYSGRNSEPVGDPVITTVPIGATQNGELVYAPNYEYNMQTRPFNKQLDDNLNRSASLTLIVPIFNNKVNSLAIDRARIQHEQAKNRLESQQLTLQTDVQSALVAQRNAYRRYESAKRSQDATDASLKFAEERYAQGVITAIELNTAKTRAQVATAELINAKYSYLMAQKSLDILQGLPLTL